MILKRLPFESGKKRTEKRRRCDDVLLKPRTIIILALILMFPHLVLAQVIEEDVNVVRKADYGFSFFYNDSVEIFTKNVTTPTATDNAIYDLLPGKLTGKMAMIGITQKTAWRESSIQTERIEDYVSSSKNSLMLGLVESSIPINKTWENNQITYLDFTAQFVRLKVYNMYTSFFGLGFALDKMEGSFKFRSNGQINESPDRNFTRTTASMFFVFEFEIIKGLTLGFEYNWLNYDRTMASNIAGNFAGIFGGEGDSKYNDFFDYINASGATLRMMF